MKSNFEYVTNLQYKVKALSCQVEAFRSGEKYAKLQSEFRKQLALKDREIKSLKLELSKAHSQTVSVRKSWMEIMDDLEKDHKKELERKDKEIAESKKLTLEQGITIDSQKEKLKETITKLYQVMTELEEEKGKNQKLKAQINRDYENSAISSAMNPNHKKIPNNREKTERKPGGQTGHKGHRRKKYNPTKSIPIPGPEKYANSSNFKPTGKTISKQLINLSILLDVKEYFTPEYRNVLTGQRVHAEFPPGVINEVNYGGSIKAFAFLLNSRCCVSMDKVRDFLSDLTKGELKISKGMISGLCKEFSKKTEAEQRTAFNDILLSPILGIDFTACRLNGKNVQVAVCATPETALYFARENKGHAGVAGTPVENYHGILIHDHDKTFYNYGDGHQECLSHVLRYLKDSIENEANLKWNRKMWELIREMIHYRNSSPPNPDIVKEYVNRYRKALKTAKDEYENVPPSKYYREGYNLYMRLEKYMDSHLLFLHDSRVPTNNNLCERLLRVLKRKQKQAMTFRSFESLHYLCNSMGVMASLGMQEDNLYASIAAIFD